MIEFDNKELERCIRTAMQVCAPKSTLPALEMVRLAADKGILTITATDQDYVIIAAMPCFGEMDILVSPSKILPALSGEFKTADINGNILTLKTSAGKFSIPFIDGSEFIETPDVKDFDVECQLGRDELKKLGIIAGYCSKDEFRPGMNGVMIQPGEDLVMAATDSYRLAWTKLPESEGIQYIIPRDGAALISKTFDQCTIKLAKDFCLAEGENLWLISRLIGDRFPLIHNVINPEMVKYTLSTTRTVLRDALNTASRYCNEESRQIRVKFGEQIVIHAVDVDYNLSAEINLEGLYDGEEVEIGFNSRLFLEAMPLCNEEIEIKLSDTPSSPVYLNGKVNHMLMPVRI